MTERERAADAVFRFRILSIPGIRHGVTGRVSTLGADGNVSFLVGDDRQSIQANRRAWAAAVGVDPGRIVAARQVHGASVACVSKVDVGRGAWSGDDALPGFDALITDEPHLPLMALAADCVPLLFVDPARRAIGAAHAGWRGTVSDVAGETVRAMHERFGTDPADLLVGIGPSIGPCCYLVGDEVITMWRESGLDPAGTAVLAGPGQPIFDLWQANQLCLERAGVRSEHVEQPGVCTRCNADRYFSYRSRRRPRGLFGAIIMVDEEAGELRDDGSVTR
jgi:YfiH family protein